MAESDSIQESISRKERRAAYIKKWQEDNKERVQALHREHYLKNRDKYIEKAKAWWSTRTELDRIRSARWRAENPELARSVTRKYRQKNLDKHAAGQRNRNSRKKNAIGTHTADDIKLILKAQDRRCAYCRMRLKKYHVDHIIALSKGGTNDRRNLQVLCVTCNTKKGNRDPLDFMRAQGALL